MLAWLVRILSMAHREQIYHVLKEDKKLNLVRCYGTALMIPPS